MVGRGMIFLGGLHPLADRVPDVIVAAVSFDYNVPMFYGSRDCTRLRDPSFLPLSARKRRASGELKRESRGDALALRHRGARTRAHSSRIAMTRRRSRSRVSGESRAIGSASRRSRAYLSRLAGSAAAIAASPSRRICLSTLTNEPTCATPAYAVGSYRRRQRAQIDARALIY